MRQEVKPLTGLRGLAACYVVIYHYAIVGDPDGRNLYWQSTPEKMLLHGYLAVDLFFVLSGFVMALSYAKMFSKLSMRSYAVFLSRRVARVYPLYFIVLCVIGIAQLFGIGDPPGQQAPSAAFLFNLLLVQSWGLSYPFNKPSWSISTEFAAYLLFPAILAITVRSKTMIALLVSAGAFGCLLVLGLQGSYASLGIQGISLDLWKSDSPYPLIRCLLEFSIGLLAFRFSDQLPRPALISVLAAVAIVVALALPGVDVVAVLLFAILIASLLPSVGPVARFLALPPIHLLGELSYAIYLIHWQFLRFDRLLPPRLAPHLGMVGARIVTNAFVMAAVLGTAAACYRFVEIPGRAIVRRWARRLDGPTPA